MKNGRQYLAFDLGAGSGRAILGSFDGECLTISEENRFFHSIQGEGGMLSWDIRGIERHLLESFCMIKRKQIELRSFGIDAWGVDFGLLDKDGKELLTPQSYRRMTESDKVPVHTLVAFPDLYRRTGMADNPLNTIYQIYKMKLEQPGLLDRAGHLLMVASFLMHALTDEIVNEKTAVSTSMLYSHKAGEWDRDLIKMIGVRDELFGEIVNAGTRAGRLTRSVGDKVGYPGLTCVAVGTLDTSSAVSVNVAGPYGAHISSGTWSLLGIETSQPIISDYARDHYFSNEIAVQGTYRPVKNLSGMWILQQCLRKWNEQGMQLTYAGLTEAAAEEEPWRSLIDVDEERFQGICDMPSEIQLYCAERGLPVPETPARITRCFLESLALKYKQGFSQLQKLVGHPLTQLQILGGGSKNEFLNQLSADVLSVPLLAGPAEASAIGNLVSQLIADGEVKDISEARDIVVRSFPPQVYFPRRSPSSDGAYNRFQKL